MGIRESRARDIADGYYLTFLADESLTPAQRQYMHNTRDPNGHVWREAYYGFRRGQEAKHAEAVRVAEQFGVTVKHLKDGEDKCLVRLLFDLHCPA